MEIALVIVALTLQHSSDYRVIFEPLLDDMWEVLREQLDAVKEKRNGDLVQVSCHSTLECETHT
jgi:hypothetical protein